MRESGEKHRKKIKAHTRNVPRAFLCTGVIPASIGGLINLQTLDLSYNAQYEQDEDGDDDYDRQVAGTGLSGSCVCSSRHKQ